MVVDPTVEVPVVEPAESVSALTMAEVVMADEDPPAPPAPPAPPVEVSVTVLDGEVTMVVAVAVATPEDPDPDPDPDARALQRLAP